MADASASITITFDDGTTVTEDGIPLDLALELYDWLREEGVEFEIEFESP